MRGRGLGAALVFVATAAVLVTADLAQTARAVAAGSVAVHQRPASYVLLAIALCSAWTAAILLTRSVSIAVAGGVVLGGALGNVAALLLWPSLDGVPDPLVWRGVAFSLGDAAIGIGLVLVVAATTLFALRNRGRLREPVLR